MNVDLQRFVSAQDRHLEAIEAELRAGHKESHWMWFAFPQIDGLGRSPTARRFAIASLEEAVAYLEHSVLSSRLLRWTELVLAVPEKSAFDIFLSPDDMKFHASMTLFREASRAAAGEHPCFQAALDKYFEGVPHERTLELL